MCIRDRKKGWKRPLLFIQFAGVAFICGLMCVVMVQYLSLIHIYNPAERNAPSQMITAFSMACSSSRMLPDQGCSISFSRAALSRRKAGFPYCLQRCV